MTWVSLKMVSVERGMFKNVGDAQTRYITEAHMLVAHSETTTPGSQQRLHLVRFTHLQDVFGPLARFCQGW